MLSSIYDQGLGRAPRESGVIRAEKPGGTVIQVFNLADVCFVDPFSSTPRLAPG